MKRMTIILLTLMLAMTMLATPAFAADGGSAAVSPVAGKPGKTVEVILSLDGFDSAETIGVIFDYPEALTLVADACEWLVEGDICDINSETKIAGYTGNADLNGDVLKLVFQLPETEEPQNFAISLDVLVKQYNVVLYHRTVEGSIAVHASETDHTFVWKTTKEATCEDPGEKTGTCLCGEVKMETINAPGHSYSPSWKTTKPATCAEAGEKRRECKNCDHYETDVIPATGHSYGDWTTTKEATCTKEGEKRRDCEYCDHYETDVIAKKDHSYKSKVTAPTCTAEGYTTYTCSACSDSYVDTYVDAKGHTEADAVKENEKAATCEAKGSYDSVIYCSVCDAELSRETVTVAATGHSYGDWVAEGSKEVRTCSVCDKKEERDGQKAENPFVDVAESAFYYEPVLWAVKNGITAGYGNDYTFAPDVVCSRGQVVTFLWRAAGEPAPTSSVNPFTDIQESDYFYKAVLWAVEEGITSGYGSATIFNPNGSCTRGQVATFLHRYFGEPAPASSNNPFKDVNTSEFYYTAVLWAVEKGVTNGYGSNDTFAPNVECNRGQIVTFLYRAMN